MHNFNNTKLIFATKFILIVAIAFIISQLFKNDITTPERITIKEMYDEDYVDYLFVGASITKFSIDPYKLEKETEKNVYCLGTSGQKLRGSYYLIKEANENSGIGTVYLDLSYNQGMHKDEDTYSIYIITDYMKNGFNKYTYLLESTGICGVLNDIFKVLHGYSAKLSTVREHLILRYKNNDYNYVCRNNIEYRGKGYTYVNSVVDENCKFIADTGKIDKNKPISNFSYEYLDKICQYCEDENIELFFVIPPSPDGTLVSLDNYQSYVDAINLFAKERNIEVWNFTLAKKELLSLDRNCYFDEVHINGYGSELYTEAICNLIKNGYKESYFYSLFEDKTTNNPDNTCN